MDKQSLPEKNESKSGKIFFLIFGLLILGSVFATYYYIVIAKNYLVEAQKDCDPETQKCFVWTCDPASTVEGEACTGDAEKDIWYYNLIKRNASKVPLCDPKDENCQALSCAPGEKDCNEIFCTEENKVEQGVECNDPAEYVKNNPPEEEAVESVGECAPEDAQCANAPDAEQE
ncbi:MAG: hypothetical protein WA064_04400 [Candidatus Moraniibacteriota bacterium]